MIDLSSEIPMTLRAACSAPQLRRNGRKPHIASVYRWVTRGCRGIVLESVVCAGSRVTTLEAIDRWIAALTASAGGDPTPVRTPIRRQRDHDRAQANLEEAGW
jgi:hypothetical protein